MFDTTVFNRISFYLGEIVNELHKANELKAKEINCMFNGQTPAPTVPNEPIWNPGSAMPKVGTPYVAKAVKVKEPWPFPTNDKP